MSLDTQKLVMLIKQAAVEAVNAKDPMSLKIGEVTSISPLKIRLNQKLIIPESQILLTNAVRDFYMYEVNGQTSAGKTIDVGLTPGQNGTENKKITVHLGLKVGEKVILLRCDGGQKFIVLDRLEVLNG